MKLRLFTLALLLCMLTVATHISAVEPSAPVEPAATGITPCAQAESSDELTPSAYVARNGKTYTFDDIVSITVTNEGPTDCPIDDATKTYVIYEKDADNVSAEDEVNNEIDVDYAELPAEIVDAMQNDPGKVVVNYDIESGEITYSLLEIDDDASAVVEDDEPSLLDYIVEIHPE